MTDLTRRDAAKLAAGMATTALIAGGALAQEPSSQADPRLERIGGGSLGKMFLEQTTSQIKGSRLDRDLYVTSAAGADADDATGRLKIRDRVAVVFRTDPSRDEFTKQGGFYWECGDEKGQVLFKQHPFVEHGERLVMAVRESDGTVRWYSLIPDLRC